MRRRLSSSRILKLYFLLVFGTFLLPACQRNADKEPPGPQQSGYLVHRFEELAKCIPTANDEYAWLLTSNYNSRLAPYSVYLATEYGEILPEKKPLSGGEKIKWIWAIPNVPYQLWAATDKSLFLIEVPHNNAPLVDQAKFTQIFRADSAETISRLVPVPNSRSGWLITERETGGLDKYSLHAVDADKSPPVTNVAVPEDIGIRAIFASPTGNSAWLVWQKSPGFTQTEGGAMFLENKEGGVVAKQPVAWGDYALHEAVPIKDGRLAWKLNRDFLLPNYFTGSDPALVSHDGGIWSISDRLFEGASISYAVSENIGGELPMWVWEETKPGVYLIEATTEGPRLNRRFIEDVVPQSIVPSRDGKSAWVLNDSGRIVYRLGTDGSAQKFELTLDAEMHATHIRPSQNGQKAWVVAGQPQKPGESEVQQTYSLFFLDASKSEQNFKKVPLTPKSSVILPTVDNQHAFSVDPSVPLHAGRDIKELKYYLLSDDKVENRGESLLTVHTTIDYSWAESLSRLWVRDGRNYCWVVRWQQGPITTASVKFNNTEGLNSDKARKNEEDSAPSLSPGTTITSATVDLKLEGQRSASEHDGTAQLIVFDGKSGDEVYKTPEVKLHDTKLIQINWDPPLNRPYDIDLIFKDSYGSKSLVRWSNVTIVAPLWQRPWLLTVLLFVGIFVATAVLTGVLKHGIRRWIPLLPIALSSAMPFLAWIGAEGFFDAKIFALLVFGSAIVLLLVSLFSTTVFRTLAQVHPFQKIIPHFLRRSKLRREMFVPYVQWLRDQLNRDREGANYEVYIPIPATIEPRNAQKRRVPYPAQEIAASLTKLSGPKTNVLITAPGGTGKSALLREVVGQSLTRFLEDPRFALPIICKAGEEKSLEEMAHAALGKHAISPEILSFQIDAGHFFLVIDGPQEVKLSAEQISKWVKSERGHTAVLLIASRPKDDIRRSLQLADHWCLVTPERLTDETLDLFQETYMGEAKSDPPPLKLTPALKEICRGADGSYLPILVRLALLVGSAQPHSIAQLYEQTFRHLLRKNSSEEASLLDAAGKLCVDTYWQKGQRSIRFNTAPEERGELMKQLMNAGVLVRSDGAISQAVEPREVRFFHDSMQDYLTARGLLNGESDWKEALSEAAAHPRFREAEHADDPEHGSELFRMCLQVFGTGNELQQALRSDLLRWASIHDKDLTRNDVEQSLPPAVRAEFNQQVAPELGAGAALVKAVEMLTISSDSKRPQELGALYARIAEKAWAIEQNKNANQAPVRSEQTPD